MLKLYSICDLFVTPCVSIRIMRSLLFVIALLFASVLCQEYTMGTKAQPKADLPVDDKLIIQNIVSHCA